MRLIWTPRDGERREWTFRPLDLPSMESETVEALGRTRIGGIPAWESFEEWGRLFMQGNLRAQRAALWLMLQRERDIDFHDLNLYADELTIEFEPDEVEVLREQVAAVPLMDPMQRAYLLAVLGEPAEDGAPLELSPSGGVSTAGT